MNKPNDDEKTLDTYLKGDSSLSAVYQKLKSSPPGEEMEQRILQHARIEINATKRRWRWTLPVAMAAVLLIGVTIVWWQRVLLPAPEPQRDTAAPVPDNSVANKLDSQLHNNPTADAWLNRILKLQQAGKDAKAAAEFRKFRQTYPVYSLDPNRFASLKKYDQ